MIIYSGHPSPTVHQHAAPAEPYDSQLGTLPYFLCNFIEILEYVLVPAVLEGVAIMPHRGVVLNIVEANSSSYD